FSFAGTQALHSQRPLTSVMGNLTTYATGCNSVPGASGRRTPAGHRRGFPVAGGLAENGAPGFTRGDHDRLGEGAAGEADRGQGGEGFGGVAGGRHDYRRAGLLGGALAAGGAVNGRSMGRATPEQVGFLQGRTSEVCCSADLPVGGGDLVFRDC